MFSFLCNIANNIIVEGISSLCTVKYNHGSVQISDEQLLSSSLHKAHDHVGV